MGARTLRTRRRRGSNVVEFALILPIFFAFYIGIIEFGWYFFQHSAVTDAARLGCREAALLDIDDTTFEIASEQTIIDSIEAVGVSCSAQKRYYGWIEQLIRRWLGQPSGSYLGAIGFCIVEVEDNRDDPVPRLTCNVEVGYTPISGGFLNSSTFGGYGMVPQTIHARVSAVSESADRL